MNNGSAWWREERLEWPSDVSGKLAVPLIIDSSQRGSLVAGLRLEGKRSNNKADLSFKFAH